MTRTVVVGIEVPGAELVSRSGPLPRLLDQSAAGYVVLGVYRSVPTELAAGPAPSPTIVGTALARRTRRIGIVVSASPQRDHPYNVARRVASLDHIAGGRAGLLAAPRDRSIDLGVGTGSVWARGVIDAPALADSVIAARTLWRTWPISSLDPDPAVAGAAELHFADHTGLFATRGPLNVPTTPQGEPVVFWHLGDTGAPPAAELTAAAVADVLLVDAADLASVAGGLADLGGTPAVHVRVAVDEGLLDAAAALLAHSFVSGLTLLPGRSPLAEVTGVHLPALVEAGLVATDAGGQVPTLRTRLGVPRRREPDLSGNALVFPSIAKESA